MRDDLYEGKAKRVQLLPQGLAEIYFKDDATAGNGKKRATFPGKGALCCRISELLLSYLSRRAIPTHLVERRDDRTLICRAVEIIPLEVVVRFEVAGSLRARTGLPQGQPCTPPICELYYKRDDLGDPLINDDHVRLLGLASPAELATLRSLALAAAQTLRSLLLQADVALFDLKFEFGRAAGSLWLADEISPDTCRFRDVHSGQVLDKDVFRQDLAELVPTYAALLARLEALPELSPQGPGQREVA
jgi:phosphoribosylaminoimidazole-succinocarboxamide synthase